VAGALEQEARRLQPQGAAARAASAASAARQSGASSQLDVAPSSTVVAVGQVRASGHARVRASGNGRERGRSTRSEGRLSKDAYRRQREVVDAELIRLGLRKNHLELELSKPAVQANFIELRRVSSELADVESALAVAEDTWLALEERAP
jgi:hypothetical protein